MSACILWRGIERTLPCIPLEELSCADDVAVLKSLPDILTDDDIACHLERLMPGRTRTYIFVDRISTSEHNRTLQTERVLLCQPRANSSLVDSMKTINGVALTSLERESKITVFGIRSKDIISLIEEFFTASEQLSCTECHRRICLGDNSTLVVGTCGHARHLLCSLASEGRVCRGCASEEGRIHCEECLQVTHKKETCEVSSDSAAAVSLSQRTRIRHGSMHEAEPDRLESRLSQLGNSSLWMCLSCGHVGCGRYDRQHALFHWRESGHRFSREVGTASVWDYANDAFVHRLFAVEKGGSQIASLEGTMEAGRSRMISDREEDAEGGLTEEDEVRLSLAYAEYHRQLERQTREVEKSLLSELRHVESEEKRIDEKIDSLESRDVCSGRELKSLGEQVVDEERLLEKEREHRDFLAQLTTAMERGLEDQKHNTTDASKRRERTIRELEQRIECVSQELESIMNQLA